MQKYLCFLDLDGVLASSRVHAACPRDYPLWCQFDPVAIQFFNWIHDEYPIEYVLMSTWKNGLDVQDTMVEHWVQAAFANAGFRGTLGSPWKTNPENQKYLDRAYEVKNYLSEFAPNCEDFLLFDDTRYRFDEVLCKKRHVKTDSHDGLLFKHMLNAKSLMGTWSRK